MQAASQSLRRRPQRSALPARLLIPAYPQPFQCQSRRDAGTSRQEGEFHTLLALRLMLRLDLRLYGRTAYRYHASYSV